MKGKMRALFKKNPGPGAEMGVADIPKPASKEVLIKIKASSICGTDFHIYNWDSWSQHHIKTPRIFGHEFSGEVVEVGSGVTSLNVGDYVSSETHIVCEKCFQCKTGNGHVCTNTKILGIDIDGIFAEYVVLPEVNIIKNDLSIPPEVASIQEPFGNAVHSTFVDEIVGNRVVVFGCGPIGLFCCSLAKSAGASFVIGVDIKNYRLKLAKKMKADIVLNGKKDDVIGEIMKLTEDRGGVDVFLEMSGSPDAIQQGFKVLRPGGWASLLGIPSAPFEFDISEHIVFKGATVYGIIGRRMYDTWYKTQSILKSKIVDVTPVITHKFKLEEFEKGFQLMKEGKCGKVILIP